MDITTRITTLYVARCCRCDATGPHGHTKQEAAIVALDEGWIEDTHFNGQAYYSDTFCPSCWTKRIREEIAKAIHDHERLSAFIPLDEEKNRP